MKASLFDDDDDEENMDIGNTTNHPPAMGGMSKSRPVILEPRPTVLQKRDPIIDDIAHSMLSGNSYRSFKCILLVNIHPTSLLKTPNRFFCEKSPLYVLFKTSELALWLKRCPALQLIDRAQQLIQ